jgi:MOSC domain-containing protein YiiM
MTTKDPLGTGQVVSVNIGRAVPMLANGHSVLSAIRKTPVEEGTAEVRPLGLAGDEQADLSVHGGLAKAVYMYPAEHYLFWNTVRGQALRGDADGRQAGLIPYADVPALGWGALGENLSVTGFQEAELYIGDVMVIGDGAEQSEFFVSSPRQPCFKFNIRMGFNQAAKLMVQSGYCGWYLEVRKPGLVKVGDVIRLYAGDRHVTVAQQFEMLNRKARNG